VAFLFVSCLNDKNQPSPTTTGNDGNGGTTTIPITPTTVTCSPDTVYFQQTILPLITSNCAMSGCHDAISHKDGVILTDYAHIRAYSSATNPTGSTLYKSVVNGYMPPKAPWSATQKATLLKWMQQGAKNNSCVASSANCDTVNVTYSATVAPVLKTYCVGCHSAASPSAGIDLSTYAVVKVQAANGRLVGSITHAVGYKPMPSATSKLGSCEINQIQAWITKGMLNN
jgi:mono/diheme cytochrome c family protein